MKKLLLISLACIASLALITSCTSNKYVGQYESLTKSTVAKLDSVTTVEQYNSVVTDYTATAEELKAKYSQETFSEKEINKLKELTATIAAKFYDVQAKLPLSHPEIIEEETEEEEILTN